MSAEFALINQLIRGWFDNRGQFCRSLLGGRGGSPRESYPCTPGIAGIPPQSAPPPPTYPGPPEDSVIPQYLERPTFSGTRGLIGGPVSAGFTLLLYKMVARRWTTAGRRWSIDGPPSADSGPSAVQSRETHMTFTSPHCHSLMLPWKETCRARDPYM